MFECIKHPERTPGNSSCGFHLVPVLTEALRQPSQRGHCKGEGPLESSHMGVGRNLCLFGDGSHSAVLFLEGFQGVFRGTGVLTHCHMAALPPFLQGAATSAGGTVREAGS